MRTTVIVAACVAALTFAADDKKPDVTAGDTAWQETRKFFSPPPPPAEWRTNEPTKQQIADYEKSNGVLAGQGADKAKEFYTKFPSHPKAKEAQTMELKLLGVAVELGVTNRQADFRALEEKRLGDPTLSADEKFELRSQRVARMFMEFEDATNGTPILEKSEKAIRELDKDFPNRGDIYDLLMMVAKGYLHTDNVPKARALTEEVANKAAGDTKELAEAWVRKFNLVGKPIEVKFADMNGKQVDLKDYVGKVVLVDFWATWCGPCRELLPHFKEIYSKYHERGFEILGINLDKDKDEVLKVLTDEGLTWPQSFDGLGWENKVAEKYEISSLPAAWLVDKKGNLRDLNGHASLASKVDKLLVEK